MRIARASAFAVLALLAALPTSPRAEDAPAPALLAPEEIEAAAAIRKAMPANDAALLNTLRFLLQPEFETELLAGRHVRRCTLAPFENPDQGAFGLPERARLWAVLECGMPVSPALEAQLQRLLDQPVAESAGLPSLALDLLAVRAALQQARLGRAEALMARAQALHAASLKLADACGADSPLVRGDYIDPRWFALQLWRAALTRAAADCIPGLKDRQWEDDLRPLLRAWVPERGFVPRKHDPNSATEDATGNLAAFCALRLAAEAPKGLLPSGLVRDVQRRLKDAPEVLARLQRQHKDAALGHERLLLLVSLPATAAPKGSEAAPWRAALCTAAQEALPPAGAAPGLELGSELALAEAGAPRGDREALQTALLAVALRGGLFSGLPAPLAAASLADVGRRLHALAVLQASRARRDAADFNDRVKAAIAAGCEFVAGRQDADGSFRGTHQQRLGNTALCLLALLHGETPRDGAAVQRGLDSLLKTAKGQLVHSYDMALMLMFFQAYHEREQREAGLLDADSPEQFEKARQRVHAALPAEHRALIVQLAKDLQDCAVGDRGYGYSPVARTGSDAPQGHTDNSCSQYSMLGLKAASMLGAPVSARAFNDEARRLVKTYWKSDALEVEYVHGEDEREGTDDQRRTRVRKPAPRRGTIGPGGWNYMTTRHGGASLQMTAAGISSLTVCMDELKVRGMLDAELAFDIGLTIRGARAFLSTSYYAEERLPGYMENTHADGNGTFYNLYAVERACVLADIRKLDDNRDWYVIGAEALLDAQEDDGSWLGKRQEGAQALPPLANVCMAILFLKQASMPVITEHKKRQPPAAEPSRPITPGPEDKKD